LLWIVAAALAPVLCRGRVRRQTLVCGVLIFFAIGGATLVAWLPGFRLFRQPTRMLLIASLPVALLAGVTTQELLKQQVDWERCRRVLVRVGAAIAILTGGFAVRQLLQGKEVALHGYWATLLVTLPATYWIFSERWRVSKIRPALRAAIWGLLLLVDSWALVRPLVAVRDEREIYAPSACVAYLASEGETASRVLDVDAGNEASPLGRGAPLAMLDHLEAVRGYNPLDVRWYKEYLQRIAGDAAPLRPFAHPLAFPIIGGLPMQDRAMLDLLGVRYLLQPRDVPVSQPGWRKVCDDPNPSAFDVVTGGRRKLVPYSVYENEQALPRVFVAASVAPPGGQGTVDFRREVLLEDVPAQGGADGEPGYWSAAIREYQPNRVTIDVSGTAPGWLVLTDIWYPGWTSIVDGEPSRVHRADHVFRAVHVDAGRHEVIFRFEPASLRLGRAISLVGLGTVLGILLVPRRWLKRTRVPYLNAPVASRMISVG
jgi:hypothetical protein